MRKKISKSWESQYPTRQMVNKRSVIKVTDAIFSSHIRYGAMFYLSPSIENLTVKNRAHSVLQKKLNAVARAILYKRRSDHITEENLMRDAHL